MSLPRTFWRLATATGVSNLSDGLVSVVMPLIALQLTGSPIVVALVGAATRLPWLLFALVAGAIIDRTDRRTLMLRAQLLRFLGLAALTGMLIYDLATTPLIVIVALLLGIAEVFYDTAAQTILPTLVSQSALPAANGRLFGIEATANTFVGPPLAGLLVALSATTAVAAGSAAYLVAALFVLAIPGSFRVSQTPQKSDGETHLDLTPGSSTREGYSGTSSWSRIVFETREGLSYLISDRILRHLTLLVAVSSFTSAAIAVVLPIHVVGTGPMGLTETGYGLLVATSGIGAVLAALISEKVLDLIRPGAILCTSIVAVALMHGLLVSESPIIVGAALALMSFFVVLWNVVTVSYRQATVPDGLLGRVNAAYRMFAWGAAPIGAMAGGLVASATSTHMAFVACSLAVGCTIPVVWRLRDIYLPSD